MAKTFHLFFEFVTDVPETVGRNNTENFIPKTAINLDVAFSRRLNPTSFDTLYTQPYLISRPRADGEFGAVTRFQHGTGLC